jgi:O-antigen ligase
MRYPYRLQTLLLAAMPVLLAMVTVVAVVRGGTILLAVAALAAASVAAVWLTLGPQELFLVWLAAAPFVQSTLGSSGGGHNLRVVIYSAPPLLFALWALVHRRSVQPTFLDALPALYFVLVVVSAALSPTHTGLTHLYSIVGVGIVVYYFCAFAVLGNDVFTRIARVLLATGSIAAAWVIVQRATGAGSSSFQLDTVSSAERAAGTFGSPAVFGTFLGAVLTLALTILVWKGPQQLRRLSVLTLVVATPALFLTLTRGPLLAAGSVAILVLVTRARTRWLTVVGVVIAATAVVTTWGAISSTHLYKTRFSDKKNVQARVVIDNWSFKLAAEKPAFGWGYGSFDRVKNASTFSAKPPLTRADVLPFTSHNTYLTILVETGVIGLGLLLTTWFVVARRSLAETRWGGPNRWALVGLLAILGVWIVNAGTFDMRFFSFVSALPWLAVGLMRRLDLDRRATAA